MTVSWNTQSFHDARRRLEKEDISKEETQKVLESFGYDYNEYAKEYNKFDKLWDAGKINPEEGFGGNIFEKGIATATGTIGDIGRDIVSLGEMVLPEDITKMIESGANMVGEEIPDHIKKAFIEIFDPYHGETTSFNEREIVADIGSYMAEYGISRKAAGRLLGMTPIGRGVKLGVGLGGKLFKEAAGILGANALWTTGERPDESIRTLLSDAEWLPEKYRPDPIADDDPDAYQKMFIDNLGIEVALFGLGSGIIKGAKGVKGTGVAKAIGSKFGSRRATDDHMVTLATERDGAAGAALSRARGFNVELEKELQNKKLYTEDYLENIVNEALGGNQAALGRLRQDSTVAADLVTDMRNEIDTLSRSINNNFVVDSKMKAAIDKNIGTYLNRSYRAFDEKGTYKVGKLDARDRNNARNYLMSKGMSPAVADANLKRLVEQTDDDKFLGTFFDIIKPKGAGTSSAPLKSKKDLPPEIRAVLGPVNDPFKNFSNTLEKLSVIQAEYDFLESVARHMKTNKLAYGKGLAPTGATQNLGDIDRKVRGISQLIKDGKLKNPLEGLYADKYYRDFIREGLDTDGFWGSSDNSFLRAFLKLKSVSQISKTVGSPVTHGRNMFGNAMILTANGMVPNWKGLTEGWKQISRVFKNPNSREATEQLAKYQKHGIVDSGISANIIRKTAIDSLKNKTPSTWMTKIMKGTGAEKAFKLYQAEDDIFKIMHFEKTLKFLKRAHPTMDIADVERLAAQRTRDLMPNYNLVPKAFKKLRGAPVGDFLAFPAEMTRISKNLLKYTMQDMVSGNAVLTGEGMKKLAGLGVVGVAGDAAQNYTANLFGISPDQDQAFNKLFPVYAKDTAKIYLSPFYVDNRGHGVLEYVNLGPADPFEYLKTAARKAFRLADKYYEYGESPSGQEIWNTSLELMDQVMGPYLGSSMITDSLLNIVDAGGKVDTTNDFEKYIMNSGVEIGKLFEPGVIKLLRNRWDFEKAKAKQLTGSATPSIDTWLADATGREATKYGYSIPATAGDLGAQFIGKKMLDVTGGMPRNVRPIMSKINNSNRELRAILGDYMNDDPQKIVDAYWKAAQKKKDHLIDLRNYMGAVESLFGDGEDGFFEAIEYGLREGLARPQIPLKTQKAITQARDNKFIPDDLPQTAVDLALNRTGSPLEQALPYILQLHEQFTGAQIMPEKILRD